MEEIKRQFTEVQLPVPWGHVAAKVYGSPTEKRILVVHGILDNAGSFDRLIALLPEQYHYVSIDLPGHGFSSPFPPSLPLNYFNYVHTVKLVLDALKWNTCDYIGHSFGAQLAIFFSVLHPGRLERIVALDGILPLPVENDELLSTIQQFYNIESYASNTDVLHTKEETIHALQFKRKATLNSGAANAMFNRMVTKVGELYRNNRDPRLRMILRPLMNIEQLLIFLDKLSTPVLMFLPTGSNRLQKLFYIVDFMKSHINDKSRFSVVSVPGNHDVHNNQPEVVAPHICEYLNGNIKSNL